MSITSTTATTGHTAASATNTLSLAGGGNADAAPQPKASEAQARSRIPWPSTKDAHRRWQLEQMAAAFRIFAKLGFADGGSGHISVRDPIDSETFWINPYAVHFGLLCVSDMVRVDKLGNRIDGADSPVNTAGFIIHAAIHDARPDINAACHVHSPYGRAWSNFGRPIDMLNQDSCMFYDDLAVYSDFGGVVFAAEEGRRIALSLGPKHKNIILQNHGLLTCGGTVAEAAAFFIALERACQTQLLTESVVSPGSVGHSSGLRKTFVAASEAEYTKKGTGNPEVMYLQFKPEYDLIVKETGGDFLH